MNLPGNAALVLERVLLGFPAGPLRPHLGGGSVGEDLPGEEAQQGQGAFFPPGGAYGSQNHEDQVDNPQDPPQDDKAAGKAPGQRGEKTGQGKERGEGRQRGGDDPQNPQYPRQNLIQDAQQESLEGVEPDQPALRFRQEQEKRNQPGKVLEDGQETDDQHSQVSGHGDPVGPQGHEGGTVRKIAVHQKPPLWKQLLLVPIVARTAPGFNGACCRHGSGWPEAAARGALLTRSGICAILGPKFLERGEVDVGYSQIIRTRKRVLIPLLGGFSCCTCVRIASSFGRPFGRAALCRLVCKEGRFVDERPFQG